MTDVSRSLDSRDVVRNSLVPPVDSQIDQAGHPLGENGELEEGGGFANGGVSFAIRLEAAKLESLAEFAAGAGHEINNPLATISGRVQMLLREEKDPERRQALLTIGGQALRIRDMIGDLMLFGRPPQPRPEFLAMDDAVHEVLDSLREHALASNCSMGFDHSEPVQIFADPVQFRVVISSLVRNAIESQREGGEVRLSAKSARFRGELMGVLVVADDGIGLSDTERTHLFDPFFSGRQAGRGLGFGLPKCWRIVTQHGGHIEVDSNPSAGTTFKVYWPVRSSES